MRLIDADDIYRYIKTEINPYGKPFDGSSYELGLKIMKHIKEIPTAFDLDKAVEQIRKATDEHGLVDYVNDKPMITKEQAIEIVKKGGIA